MLHACLSSLQEKNEALEPNDIKKFQGVAIRKIKATVSSETKLDADASELGSKAVQEILETEGMHKNLHLYLCIHIS